MNKKIFFQTGFYESERIVVLLNQPVVANFLNFFQQIKAHFQKEFLSQKIVSSFSCKQSLRRGDSSSFLFFAITFMAS
jgi:hypothetical protein